MKDRTLSEAARHFLENAEPHEPWRLDAVESLRADDEEDAAATNPEFIERYVESMQQEELGGVRVLRVQPKRHDAALQNCCALYFFGGAFVVGSPEVDLAIIARLSYRLGVEFIAPYYRRAPEHPFPAGLDDGFAVYEALLEQCPASRIVVSGESAGGNLSLSVVLCAQRQGLDLPAALALMSPWCDLTPAGESQQQPSGFDPTLDYECHLREAAALYAGVVPQTDPRVSPVYAEYSDDFPPTIITTGTRELFLSDCERLAEKMRTSGIDVRLNVWEHMWHVFEWYADIPEADASLDDIAAFLRERLPSD